MTKRYTEDDTVERPIIKYLMAQGWTYKKPKDLDRGITDSFDRRVLFNAIKRLNPEIVKNDADVEQVINQLGNVENSLSGNKEFFDWLRNEKSISLRVDEHQQDIKIIEYDDPDHTKNEYIVSNQVHFMGINEIIPDVVLYINGIPLVVIECKSETDEDITHEDAINQMIGYSEDAPQFFKHLAFLVGTDGTTTQYGWTNPERYNHWRTEYTDELKGFVKKFLTIDNLLDVVQNFIVFETDKGEIVKKIAMQQQIEATNKIIHRIQHEPEKKNGLIWHTQGSGKTLTMLFTAWKLKRQKEPKNPTVFILIDRKQLETQFLEVFTNAELPHTRWADKIETLQNLIAAHSREVIITTIQKFQDIPQRDERENIVILIDEGHRSQYGKLASKRDETFPNASLFAFTGTPIDKEDKKDTFTEFSYPDEEELYLHKYSILQSQIDGSTVPIVYELRPPSSDIPKEILDKEFLEITKGLDKDEQQKVLETSATWSTILKAKDHVKNVAEDIAKHYKNKVAPNKYKALIVCIDREACALLKNELDKHLDPKQSKIIFSDNKHKDNKIEKLLKPHYMTRSKQLNLTRKEFQKQDKDPQILIVCNMLLTGFDAPVLRVMYLNKPMRDHNLLQAIARVNRPYEGKLNGLIADYIGIFHRIEDALNFELEDIEGVATKYEDYKKNFFEHLEKLRTLLKDQPKDPSRESLYEIIDYLNTDNNAETFTTNLKQATNYFESITPDEDLVPYFDEYTWYHKINAAYRKHKRKDQKSLKPYQQKTQKLIREKLVTEEIEKTLPTFTIGPDFLSELEKAQLSPKAKIMELKQAPESQVSMNLGRLKFYETLSERLKRILEQRDPKLIEKDLIDFINQINRKHAEMEQKQLTPTQQNLLDESKEVLSVEEPILLDFIKKLTIELGPLMFSGWSIKDETRRAVQKRVFDSLFENFKVDDPKKLIKLRDAYVKWLEREKA